MEKQMMDLELERTLETHLQLELTSSKDHT